MGEGSPFVEDFHSIDRTEVGTLKKLLVIMLCLLILCSTAMSEGGADMARSPESQHECPLLNRKIFWGDCYEIQDIRNDDMDAELFPDKFDVEEANTICEECKWYKVDENE